MSLQQYYQQFSTGHWADEDPSKCECRGSGWALSDVDTWHRCPVHYQGHDPPPEDDYNQEERCQGRPYRGDDGHLYIAVRGQFYRLHEEPEEPAPVSQTVPRDDLPF